MSVAAEHLVPRPGSVDRTGLLAIDKPLGVTSHDVVDVVRRRLRLKRAGHLGTLDPGATGLLLIATGAATRAIPAWQGGDKTYEAAMRFGLVTTTQDVHGEVIERSGIVPAEARVRDAALLLTGEIDQVPPMVSALKVGGERLYALARRGIEVERAARRIQVRSWEWLGVDGATASFRVVCSSGTYVRTLAHDLGRRLGCGAVIERLRRLRSEPFGLDRAIELRELHTLPPDEVWARAGWTLDEALAHLPTLALTAAEADSIGFGGRPQIDATRGAGLPLGSGPRSLVLRSPEGAAIALGELYSSEAVGGGGAPPVTTLEVRARVVFPWGSREGRAQ